jgi:predicted GNAT superfamily acetyltransferase
MVAENGNIIDTMVVFLTDHFGEDTIKEWYGDQEMVRQYLSFQFLHGNVMWVNDKDGNITGLLVSYTCDENDVGADFDWELKKGENCIFVAEMVTKDERSRNLLAHGFLQRYPKKKKTYAQRKGRIVEMKAHEISQTFTKDIYGR